MLRLLVKAALDSLSKVHFKLFTLQDLEKRKPGFGEN